MAERTVNVYIGGSATEPKIRQIKHEGTIINVFGPEKIDYEGLGEVQQVELEGIRQTALDLMLTPFSEDSVNEIEEFSFSAIKLLEAYVSSCSLSSENLKELCKRIFPDPYIEVEGAKIGALEYANVVSVMYCHCFLWRIVLGSNRSLFDQVMARFIDRLRAVQDPDDALIERTAVCFSMLHIKETIDYFLWPEIQKYHLPNIIEHRLIISMASFRPSLYGIHMNVLNSGFMSNLCKFMNNCFNPETLASELFRFLEKSKPSETIIERKYWIYFAYHAYDCFDAFNVTGINSKTRRFCRLFMQRINQTLGTDFIDSVDTENSFAEYRKIESEYIKYYTIRQYVPPQRSPIVEDDLNFFD